MMFKADADPMIAERLIDLLPVEHPVDGVFRRVV